MHLDINPNNIMLDKNENYVLIDFGASKQITTNENKLFHAHSPGAGSSHFRAIELGYSSSNWGPWTDFYALGATLYYLQTKKIPPSSAELINGSTINYPAEMSKKMRDLISWMMNPQLKLRPQSVEEIERKINAPDHYCIETFTYKPDEPISIDNDGGYEAYPSPAPSAVPPPYPSIKHSSSPKPPKQEEKVLHIPEKKGFMERVRSLWGDKGDLVNSAIFAPAEIAKGDDMMVQVFIYKDEETDQIVIEAKSADENATKRCYAPLNFKLRKGDKVTICLDIRSLSLSDNQKELTWQGKYTKCAFFVCVPMDYNKQKILGEVTLSVKGLMLGQLQFMTKVTNIVTDKGSAEISTKLYKRVFISYSHKDATIANAIAEGYKALGTIDYFFDRHSLSSGELFEKKIFQYIDSCDLFILCWSKNAEASEWVNKERVRAFYAALDEPPRLRLYPINIIPYASPPVDMINAFHFTDYETMKQ